jgi:DNA-binding CsgD family transcriptional regulator
VRIYTIVAGVQEPASSPPTRLRGVSDVTGTSQTAVESTPTRESPPPGLQPAVIPALLTPADIELELRRLVRHLVAGTRLLQRSQASGAGGASDRKILLDLEVDGVRCLLTRRPTDDRRMEVRLTPREREVAQMVAMGLTNSAIAGKLAVSPWTVSTHLRRIFAKLGVATRAAMVAVLANAETQPVAETTGARPTSGR